MFFKQKYMLKPKTRTLKIAEIITRLKKFHVIVEALNLTFKIQITLNSYSIFKNSLLQKLFLKRWVLSLGNWLLGPRRRAELSFVLRTEGYRGWLGILEMFLNSEWSTSSNTLYMSIWDEIYLRLKQRCRKFWTVVNSGIEEAYTGRPYVSFGKTIDLKTVSTSGWWYPCLRKHLIT